MSYKVGSISSLISNGSNITSLSDLFSDTSKQLFARSFKPDEFPKMIVDKNDEKLAEDVPKKKRKEKKVKKDIDSENIEQSDENTIRENSGSKESLTLFVGNIPVTETAKSITKFFQKFGPVESVRLRSVPVAGTKVDDAGNQNLVKKVCVNAQKFGEQKGSFNAYIVFKSPDHITAALTANNQLLGDRHLRVDRSVPTLFDTNHTVFLGNLPHYADEEELRVYFANVLPNKHDDILGIRVVRDPETLVGKGIGYLLLKDRDAVMKALSLHQELFKKRWALRVTTCGKRTKRTEQRAVSTDASVGNGSAGDQSTKPATSHPAKARTNDKKRKLDNVDFAAKRIKLKSTMTRNKYLKERHQKKDKPGKKGKRLGGVVKRAMKAAASK